ncbi:MAG: hypothetical protein IPN34_27220 [Planctomycetes bacterium]|nr:hypothetical protein [Planctomycetota bacterium]
MSLLRCSLAAPLFLSLALAGALAQERPDAALPKAPSLRIAFAGPAGTWTSELPRLAARLELLLGAQGFAVRSRELLAPGVLTLHGECRSPQKLTRRALQSLLQQPQLAPWPKLRVLLSDADPEPQGWCLEGELAFTLVKPEAVTRETIDLARELARRHLLQRGTPEAALDEMLRHLELRRLYERPSAADPKRLDVRFALRAAMKTPDTLEVSRWLALFAPRTSVDLRPAIAADEPLKDALRATPAAASAAELAAVVREASAGACEARVVRGAAAPFRRVEDLRFLAATSPLGPEPCATLVAQRDALGGTALRWTLSAAASERAAALAPEERFQLLVNGEAWGEVRPRDLAAGEGILFGEFASSDVELASRAFAPLDPPALWIAR